VIYDDTAALAKAARARDLHIADASAEYLAWGHLGWPPGTTRLVTVRISLIDHSPLACSGQTRWFGAIEACFPRTP
jgi:hypothetical protein